MFKVQFEEQSKTNQAGELIWLQQTKVRTFLGIPYFKSVFIKMVDDSSFIPQPMPTKAEVMGFVLNRIDTRGLGEELQEEDKKSKKLTK